MITYKSLSPRQVQSTPPTYGKFDGENETVNHCILKLSHHSQTNPRLPTIVLQQQNTTFEGIYGDFLFAPRIPPIFTHLTHKLTINSPIPQQTQPYQSPVISPGRRLFTHSQAGDVARVGLDVELLDPGADPRRCPGLGRAPAGRRQRGGARHGGAGARQAA